MQCLLRTDSSVRIGAGHAMRCLTLAEELRRRGATVHFSCRQLEGSVIPFIESRGIHVFPHVAGDARARTEDLFDDWNADAAATGGNLRELGRVDWLVVDHYGLDRRWEERLRGHASRILAIDDLANRRHDCDLLLDQNYYVDADSRYQALLPRSCATLLGPRYALLRPDFLQARNGMRARDGSIGRVLVFFGGSDPGGLTEKAMAALAGMKSLNVSIDVVVGSGNPVRERIQHLCEADGRFRYHCQVQNMAEFMAAADLALGAGGATTWERCFLGVPTITVALAPNQIRTTVDLAAAGACRYLGLAEEITVSRLASEIESAVAEPARLRAMSGAARQITGVGGVLGTDLVADALARGTTLSGAPRRAGEASAPVPSPGA
jgi:UDP-2,4-diacetamido-2,4,6-trideoxy-beta-L-altropyranose hydrolase